MAGFVETIVTVAGPPDVIVSWKSEGRRRHAFFLAPLGGHRGAVVVVVVTGGLLDATGRGTAFGSVITKAKMSLVVSPSYTFLTTVQRFPTPTKNTRRAIVAKRAAHGRMRLVQQRVVFGKRREGTTQRLSRQRRRHQCGEATMRTFVAPESEFRPLSAKTGDGIPAQHSQFRTRSGLCARQAPDSRRRFRASVVGFPQRRGSRGRRNDSLAGVC